MKEKQNYEAMELSKKRMLIEKNKQGILQINLNYKRNEQNNTKQWIQRRNHLLNKQAEKCKTMDSAKK